MTWRPMFSTITSCTPTSTWPSSVRAFRPSCSPGSSWSPSPSSCSRTPCPPCPPSSALSAPSQVQIQNVQNLQNWSHPVPRIHFLSQKTKFNDIFFRLPGLYDNLEHCPGWDHLDQPDNVHRVQCGFLRPLLLSLHRPQAQGGWKSGGYGGENSLLCVKASDSGKHIFLNKITHAHVHYSAKTLLKCSFEQVKYFSLNFHKGASIIIL